MQLPILNILIYAVEKIVTVVFLVFLDFDPVWSLILIFFTYFTFFNYSRNRCFCSVCFIKKTIHFTSSSVFNKRASMQTLLKISSKLLEVVPISNKYILSKNFLVSILPFHLQGLNGRLSEGISLQGCPIKIGKTYWAPGMMGIEQFRHSIRGLSLLLQWYQSGRSLIS